MSYTLKTCHVDQFLANQWNVVESFRTLEEAYDALRSPLFYTEELMLARVVNGVTFYLGVYHNGEWIKLNNDRLTARFPWNYSTDSKKWKSDRHWLDAWRTSEHPIDMMHAIWLVTENTPQYHAMIECIRVVMPFSINDQKHGNKILDDMKSDKETFVTIQNTRFTEERIQRLLYDIHDATYFANYMRQVLLIEENTRDIDEDGYEIPENHFADIIRKEIPIKGILRSFIKVMIESNL